MSVYMVVANSNIHHGSHEPRGLVNEKEVMIDKPEQELR